MGGGGGGAGGCWCFDSIRRDAKVGGGEGGGGSWACGGYGEFEGDCEVRPAPHGVVAVVVVVGMEAAAGEVAGAAGASGAVVTMIETAEMRVGVIRSV